MKSSLLKSFKVSYIISIIIFIVAICTSYFLVKDIKNYDYLNKVRMLTKHATANIQDNKFYNNYDFDYFVINLEGRVIYSTLEEIRNDTTQNLKEVLDYDNSFGIRNRNKIKWSTPFIRDKEQIGNIVYIISEEVILGESKEILIIKALTPLIIYFVLILIIMIFNYKKLKEEIVEPVNKITNSSRRIIQGDFSEKINYYDKNEVGELSIVFEEMRDELKSSIEREKKSQNNEKELIATLSHDIKTPLSAIKAYVEGLRDGVAKTEEQRKKYNSIILNKVESLNIMLDELLEVSKIGLDEMKFNRKEIYFKEYFLGIAEDIELMVTRKGFKFIFIEEIENVILNIDKKRITQVIYNIIENSIKYSNNNKEIQLVISEENKWIKIKIKDKGIGIGAEDIPLIFERFYRAEKSRCSDIQGSGLGLYISKHIIEAHGGEIKCISEIGEGSTFILYLPTV